MSNTVCGIIILMQFPLQPKQYSVISGFCTDLAKGIALSAIVGQSIILESSNLRLVIILTWLIVALLLLYMAVLISKYE